MAETPEPLGLSRGGSPEPKASILLVDDKPANLLSLRALLEDLGHNLVGALSGEEALRRMQTDEFAVVLLDVLMPGMSGFETARRMRGQDRSRHTPIIFLTANDMDGAQMEEAYALGAVDLLVKPLLPVMLQSKVRGFVELFQNRQRARQEADQLRLLVHGTAEYAIFMLDPEGRVATWNAGAERLKGYKADEIIGQHFSRFYPQDVIDRGWPAHELKVARAEGRFEDEGWRVRKDGTQFWANVVITALRDEAGNFRGFSKITRDLTERKRSEERARRLVEEATARRVAEENARQIQEQRERLQVTLASIGDAVLSTDAEGRVTFLNAVAEALTGWPQAEAVGRPLSEVFPILNERTRQPVENPALRALREGAVVGLANHTVLIARDGTERPIDDSAAPIRDAGGAVLGAVLVYRDVSERRRTEEARARLAAIVDSSDDAIVSKTLDGVITSWNQGAERLFGYSAAEAVGRSITLIIPPERHDEEPAILARLRRGERLEHFETVRVAKDGRRLDISLTISPVRDRDGVIIGASKIARDITGKKRAENALRERERLIRQVAEAGLTLHAAGSLDSVMRVIAEEARRILGAHLAVSSLTVGDGCAQAASAVSASEQYGHWLTHRIPPAVEGVCAEVCRTNRPLRLTRAELESHPAWRGDGEQGRGPPLRGWVAAPLVSRVGKSLGLIQVSDKDDGGFSESEEAALLQLGHIASVALENARLYGELREQDRRKDEFLALLAHELRNPLAPLRNGLQVLRLAQGDPDAVAQVRDMMERQLGHMVRLIDDLLDVSRISRNKMELRRSRVLLTDVVSSAVETARPAVEEAGHELTVSLPQDQVYLNADLTRLAQVFGNLLSNSAKYTPRGGRIRLAAERRGQQVVVTVRDNGIGIPAEYLGSIFDMFSQVDRSIERSTSGLGIGLALVKGLVEMHGGTVTAESPGPGRGSTFTVRLPALESRPELTAEEAAQGGRTAAGPRRRILVVDDNRDAAGSMAMMLHLLGNEVRTAHDGAAAVEAAEQFRPQVILMDVGMPRLNGLDATRRIREQPWGRSVSIIALTGWGQEADKAQSHEAGCDGHLVKPVNLPDLEKLLKELAGNRGPGNVSPRQ
jgi:PAS domain S-box-containing protein